MSFEEPRLSDQYAIFFQPLSLASVILGVYGLTVTTKSLQEVAPGKNRAYLIERKESPSIICSCYLISEITREADYKTIFYHSSLILQKERNTANDLQICIYTLNSLLIPMRVETRCCKYIETEDWKNENDALSSKIPRQLSRERPHTRDRKQFRSSWKASLSLAAA